MEITVYLLDTNDSFYKNNPRNAKYSELFKYFCIKQHTGCHFDDIQIEKGEYGKPILQNPSDLFFNISHTEGYSVCVVSEDNIGIDIEKIEMIDLDIAKKYFASAEYQYIMKGKHNNNQLNRFFEVWTMKECYLKLLGTGIYKELDSFSITSEQNHYSIVDSTAKMNRSFSCFHDIIFGKYALSVIMEASNNDNLIVELTDITNTFNTQCIL